ncbi:competence protein CoiA family protein [Leclercia pneumoniae]|uniref:competence protein CoiA family protein n=1 Tax=Leclercia pneumoniae TaxID=2815358 RepID=UPI0021E53F19|nr:competence protein CoiA family protein [Leclercia pneumoniae]MCV2510918.1 competence protein CoiA family protein [Leclercia pneumoniae]WNN82264.1 competence protein CoiA family protein [Leclercia pneumoniae]
MDRLNHIPFGLRIEDQKYVDVADVPKGRKCACICPSCKIPLIARQGSINRWHFAHASRKIDDIEQNCEYSFLVSVRAMAKQIIESGFQFSTPGCTGHVSERRHGMPFMELFCVTKPDTITLSNVQKECLFEETMVDICGEVKGFPLVIYFSHPERSVPDKLKEPGNTRCGILDIDLTWTRALFLTKKPLFDRFDDEIREFVKTSIRGPDRAALPVRRSLDDKWNRTIACRV